MLKKDPVKPVCNSILASRDIAEVTLNGKNLELLWKAPFRITVTGILQKGKTNCSKGY